MSTAYATPTDRRLQIKQLLLDNGLQVVWEEDHRQPIVAIEARIKGGLRGEGSYVGTGITHFIEHMLFKGTPTRPPGTIDQEVRRYGGSINAFTSIDNTGVSLFVESAYLKDALGMLADILQHAVFDQKEFDKERAVVISEIQMNLDDPDRRIYQLLWSRHFLEHPYRHPILGYQPLLERLTVKDMADFYAAEYQPQNIVLSCVGDVDGASLPQLAKELFGSWPRGVTDPKQQLVPAEPPTASAKDATVELPVQAAYVMLGFSSTRLSDPDLYPLDVLANILGQGRSSRLYDTIIRKRQLAHAIHASNYTPYDPGIFMIQFRTDPDKVAAATEATLAILDEIKRNGVTDAELHKAKRSVSADYLFGLQTVESKAGDVASSMASTGDPLFSRRYVEAVEQVSAEQVQAVARRYCDASKMTTAIIRPTAAQAETPASAAQAPIQLHKDVLKNGATVLTGVDHGLPIAAIVVAFRGGVRAETEHTQGISNLVSQMLTKGTATKNALQIAQQVESLGGSLEPFSGRDGFGLVLQLLAPDLNEGLALMHELVTQCTFPAAELDVQRQLIDRELQTQDDEIFDAGGILLRQTLFGKHPYRFNPLGDRKTIASVTREQCLDFAKRWLTPSNTVMAVYGDAAREAVTQQLTQTFGAMPAATSPWPAQLPEDLPKNIREASRTMQKEQALIMLGFPGSTYVAPDRYAVDVLSAVLSGMAGRLFQSVREEQGLSYTLGAPHVPGWDPGVLLVYAATRPDEQAKVLKTVEEQLQLAIAKGFTEEEVNQAKRMLIGSHRLELQHLVGLAKRSAIDELYGVGFDAWTHYEAQINAVTVSMVHEAARKHLTMQRRAQIIIGPNGHVHAPR